MRHKLFITLRFVLTLLFLASFASAQKPDQLYGRWEVMAVVASSPVTAMTGTAAGRLVGQFLVLAPRSVQFAKETCRPTYELFKETATEFLQNYKVDAKTLKLPDPVTRFDAYCTDVFILGPNDIVFTWKGYFLQAKKAHAK